MKAVIIRCLRTGDGEITGEIFFDAVQYGTAEHYTPEQRVTWTGASANPLVWRKRLRGVDGVMAELSGSR